MPSPITRLLVACSLALAAAGGVSAQDKRGQAVLPVLDASGKVEAFLLLEPTSASQAGRWRFGENQFEASFGLDAGSSLALLCSPGSSFSGAVSSLARNCQLAALDASATDRRVSATASFNRPAGNVGLRVGEGRSSLPGWVTPSRAAATAGKDLDVHDLTVFAQKNIGDDAYVSLAGTLAKATLIPSAAAPADLSDRWTSRSVSVGGGIGRFSANIVGQVVDTPGLPKWEGLGLGVSWRTPWSGQLTVGADNVVTRGRNPFSKMAEASEDEGAVPYIRYQQDL